MMQIESVRRLCDETAEEHSPFVDYDGAVLCEGCHAGEYGFLDWPCDTAMVLMALVVLETSRA